MNWAAPAAAAFLAAGYVHYAAVSELGGSALPITGWLVLFAGAFAVAMKRTLDS
jgi:hypothetical protein